MVIVSVHLLLLQQRTRDWAVYKEYRYILTHASGAPGATKPVPTSTQLLVRMLLAGKVAVCG